MKKALLITLLYLTIIICLSAVCVYYMDPIHKCLLGWKKEYIRDKEYKTMHQEKVDIAYLSKLHDDSTAWYKKYHFIGHGGGAINGKTYTNSLEAWDYSYEHGNRVVDADMTFTSDSVLVLRHSWGDNLEHSPLSMQNSSSVFVDRNGHTQYRLPERRQSYQEFSSHKIHYLYTPLSCKDMILFMKEHSDFYVSTDMKDDIVQSYTYLVNQARKMKCEDVLDRIIINFYEYEDYNRIMKIYPFKNVTARQHYVHPNNYTELIDFCVKHNIHVINVSSCYAKDEGIKDILSKGINVYVAVVDYISDMKEYKKRGFFGACTNYLHEDEWKYIN